MLKEKKKVLSKTLAFVLALVMVIGLMPVTSFAEGNPTLSDQEYQIEFYKAKDPDNKVELMKVYISEDEFSVKSTRRPYSETSNNIDNDLKEKLLSLISGIENKNISRDDVKSIFDESLNLTKKNTTFYDWLVKQVKSIHQNDDTFTEIQFADYELAHNRIKIRVKHNKYYTVSFKSEDGKVLTTQRVEYKRSAVLPDLSGTDYSDKKVDWYQIEPVKKDTPYEFGNDMNKDSRIDKNSTLVAKLRNDDTTTPGENNNPMTEKVVTLYNFYKQYKEKANKEDPNPVKLSMVELREDDKVLSIKVKEDEKGEQFKSIKMAVIDKYEKFTKYIKTDIDALKTLPENKDFFYDKLGLFLENYHLIGDSDPNLEESVNRIKNFLDSIGYKESEYRNIRYSVQKDMSNEKRPVVNVYIKPKEFTVKFDANKGELGQGTEEQVIEYRRRVTEPQNIPTRQGYKFLGWTKDQQGNEKFFEFGPSKADEFRVTKDLTLFAQWRKMQDNPIELTLTKKYLNGEPDVIFPSAIFSPLSGELEVKKGNASLMKLTLKGDALEKAKVIASNVNLGQVIKDEEVASLFYSIYHQIKTSSGISQNVKDRIDLSLNTAGYLTEQDRQKIDVKVKLEKPISENDNAKMHVNFYLNKVTVIVDKDNNEEPEFNRVEYNKRLIKPADPEKVNHKFLGWFLGDEEFKFSKNNNYINQIVSDKRITEEITIIAKWEEIKQNNPVNPPADNNTNTNTGGGGTTGGGDTAGGGGGGGGILPPTDNNTTIDDNKTPLGAAKENNLAYMHGYKDGTVNPEGAVTREVAAAIFFRLMDEKARAAARSEENSFTDVKKTDWSNKHISTLVKAGILTGYTDGSFQPQKPITRAELASMLVKFYKLEAEKEHKFSDLKGNWAEEFIAALAKKGWVGGYPDGSFLPNKTVTRAELATIINNVLGRKIKKEELPEKLNKFSDLAADKWYYEALILATTNYVSERKEDGTQKFLETFESLIEM